MDYYYDYDHDFISSKTVGLRYWKCDGLNVQIIASDVDMEIEKTDISALESKIEQSLKSSYIYGIVATVIGGTTMVSMYLGCYIHCNNKIMTCVFAGIVLASSFFIVMVFSIEALEVCMNDTQKALEEVNTNYKVICMTYVLSSSGPLGHLGHW